MKSSLFIFSLIILALFITVSSCIDEEEKLTACGVEDPLKNLEWIDEKIGDPYSWIEVEIYYIRYNKVDYIGAYYPPGCFNSYLIIFDCEGNNICRSDDQDYEWCTIWTDCDKKVLLNP